MTYNYNRLWKLLIDKGMTKTQMRLQAGISTNILAKMGKGEPVALESLAKIASALNCGLDDMVEISEKDTFFGEKAAEKSTVSSATMRNWKKLNTQPEERLMARANKRNSRKRVLPLEYITDKGNAPFVQSTLDFIDTNGIDIMSAIFSLGIGLLKKNKIYEKQHVAHVLSEYADIALIDGLVNSDLPTDEFDILGLVYQSYLQEGKKNIMGSYYTPREIAQNMTKNFDFSKGELFLDPCCGSGAFLLSVAADNPSCIFGIDNDKVAVLIAKINMLVKYRDIAFIPQIVCSDFLAGDSAMQPPIFEKRFDYIATNPPWGAMDDYSGIYPITSKESFSYFFVKAFDQLKQGGIIRFLFPEAILNVCAHKDIRKFILEQTELVSITTYDSMFSGVTTKYVDIECAKGAPKGEFYVYSGGKQKTVALKTVYETENRNFNLLSDDDLPIIRAVKQRGGYSLRSSTWALGVVTGDNKKKLSPECLDGMEKIYTGKEIQPYILQPAKKYVFYDRNKLQQVAKDEIYRAPEKLVYKFISNKLVFAYDNSASLFLNSANILIPDIPSMSAKTVMAFLNSSLFQFMYMRLFGEVKILKGNLMELPFPEISAHDNAQISALVDEILGGDRAKHEKIENYIFSLYDLTKEQIKYVRRMVNGKAN